jgi:signal peptidase I
VTQAFDSDAAADGRSGDESGPARPSSRSRPKGGRRRAVITKKPLPVWQETLLLIGTAVILALIIKTFFVQAFYIPSGSMRDTLRIDDRILVQKWSYWFGDVQRGDVVVFDDPADWLGQEDGREPSNVVTKTMAAIGLYPTGGHLVKRVIGVGGDHVACRNGSVVVNGATLDEQEYVTLPEEACGGKWAVDVPPDHIWVMGDNREHSADSRVHIADPGGGFIPEKDIVGKVFVVVWPIDHWKFIQRPATFDNVPADQAAGLILNTAPPGLALVAVPPLIRRLRRRSAASDGRAQVEETH